MHILAIAGWYPVLHDPFNGDFVKRHLLAISSVTEITLIYISYSTEVRKKSIKQTNYNSFTEIIIYLPKKHFKIGEKIFSFFFYYNAVLKEIRNINKRRKIDLVHLHVVNTNGFYALFLKFFYKIPYVITEHSTAYIDGQWEKYNKLKQAFIKIIFSNSKATHFVSAFLEKEVVHKLNYKGLSYVIPNVVDINTFYPEKSFSYNYKTFIHISNLSEQKNIEQILEAFHLIKERGILFKLKIIGPNSFEVNKLIENFGLVSDVEFYMEMPQSALNTEINKSDALILFSKFETFGCVIIEAMACGKPVIVSNLAAFKENVIHGKTGIIVKDTCSSSLSNAIIEFINTNYQFNSNELRQFAISNFSYEVVAQQFYKMYISTLQKIA